MVKSVFSDKKGLVQSAGSGITVENALTMSNKAPALSAGAALGAQAVTAAGNAQGNGGAISATGGCMVVVSAGDNTKGVVLPALADLGAGHVYFIQNNASATLEVYPASGDKISPASDNAGITVAANAMLVCIAADATQWFGFEPTVVAA